jgi:hypothetical protein
MTGIPTRADEVSPSGDEPVFSLGLPGGESSSHPGAVAAPQSLPYTSLPDGSRLYETGYTGIYAKNQVGDGFETQAKQALDKISQAPSGKRLLSDIAAASDGPEGKHASIVYDQFVAARPLLSKRQAEARNMQQNDFSLDQNNLAIKLSTKKTILGVNVGKGPGTKAEVAWDPEASLKLDSSGRPYKGLFNDSSEAHIALAHELVHSVHILKGDFKRGGDRLDPDTQAGKEELRAVGLGKYAEAPYSENSIRQELGLPLRSQYNSVSGSEDDFS